MQLDGGGVCVLLVSAVQCKAWIRPLINSLSTTVPTNLYNKEKTCFFVRPSTFYIFHYFSKSIVANGKIIIEIGFNNYKECKWKKIFEK